MGVASKKKFESACNRVKYSTKSISFLSNNPYHIKLILKTKNVNFFPFLTSWFPLFPHSRTHVVQSFFSLSFNFLKKTFRNAFQMNSFKKQLVVFLPIYKFRYNVLNWQICGGKERAMFRIKINDCVSLCFCVCVCALVCLFVCLWTWWTINEYYIELDSPSLTSENELYWV